MLLEILSIVIVVLLIALLVLTIVFHLVKPAQDNREDFVTLNKEIAKSITDLRLAVNQSIAESILSFNDKVNLKLTDNNDKATKNITDFRMNVNSELTTFQEKISSKLNGDFSKLSETIEKQMGTINEKVEERLKKGFVETNQTFVQIAERIQVIDTAQKNIEALSTEMMGLQQILTNNQSRGSFGEYQLNQLLYSVFGENKKLYEIQYTIKEPSRSKGEKVRADAVIFMPEPNGMIAVDSKFPFSEYSKLFNNKELTKDDEEKTIQLFGADVKKHITEIASKYIIAGITADYALMFVASDGILSLLHSRLPNVIEYARSKNVTIVSPTTLIPLLSSYRAVSIDYERSKYTSQIKKELNMLTKEFKQFDSEWNSMNNTILKLSKQSGDVNVRVEKITSKFSKISDVDILDNDESKTAKITEQSDDSKMNEE